MNEARSTQRLDVAGKCLLCSAAPVTLTKASATLLLPFSAHRALLCAGAVSRTESLPRGRQGEPKVATPELTDSRHAL